MLRYRDTWTPWRQCGYDYGEDEMLELDASSEESIIRIIGFSSGGDGLTCSLGASTTAGRRWGPHGENNTFVGKRLNFYSPDAKLRLRFLSGDQTYHRWILRWLPSYN